MGVFDRLRRILAGQVQAGEEDEAPEAVVNRLLSGLKQSLRESRVQVSMAVRDMKRVEREMHGAERDVQEWLLKARDAVKSGKDDWARECLKRKKTAQGLAEELRKEFDVHRKSLQVLKGEMVSLEKKIREFQVKRTTLLSKKRRLEAIQRFREKKRPELSDADLSAALGQLEEKVEVLQLTESPLGSFDRLDEQFRKLEEQDAVESAALAKLDEVEDLEDLKRLLLAAGEDGDVQGDEGGGAIDEGGGEGGDDGGDDGGGGEAPSSERAPSREARGAEAGPSRSSGKHGGEDVGELGPRGEGQRGVGRRDPGKEPRKGRSEDS